MTAEQLRGNQEITQRHAELIAKARRQAEGVASDGDAQTEAVDSRKIVRTIVQPERVGPYRILEALGEGGMGIVYLAEQTEPIHRRVALKIIKPGMDTRQVIARFETEREALAVMDHPGIAKVLDAGATPEGRPYFVMEFVQGIPITDYCDRNRLSTDERLRLFVEVCHAVQHAHQKGIIHRDLKPTNVLVALFDGRPVPKVIDFGVAKATERRLTDLTLFTEHGQIIGTPGYMSPEQAEMSPLSVDTRTDIYSLGVLLYELLVGTLPFDTDTLRRAGQAEIQRVIREVDPPKPSTKLTSLGDASTAVAHRRRSEPGTLARQLRRDLDWVVMKCLEKDRTRRYETADGLSKEVERYLAHEPVLAGPPSSIYRARKFVRRHRIAVTATTLVAVALVAGVVTTTLAASWALRERAQAIAARDAEAAARQDAQQREQEANAAKKQVELRSRELEQVVKFLSAMVSGIKVEPMGRGLLDDLRREVRAALERDGKAQADIETSLAALDTAVRPANMTNVAVQTVERNMLQPALEAVAREFVGQPMVEASLLQTVADTLRELGLYDAALVPQRRGLEIRRREIGDEARDTLTARHHLGLILEEKGDLPGAEEVQRQVLEARRRLFGARDADTFTSLNDLGWVLHRQGRLQEAEPLVRDGLEGRRSVLGDDHEDTLVSMNDLGWLYRAMDRLPEAEVLLREALEGRRRVLGPDHPDTLESLHNLGAVLRSAGKLAEAETALREAVDRRRRVLGDRHSDTLTSVNTLALVLKRQRKFAEAEPLYREALEGFRKTLGDDHPDAITALNNLGMLYLDTERYTDAEPLLKEALDRRRRTLGERHFNTLNSLSNMGLVLKKQGKLAEAEPYYVQAVERSRQVLGESHQDTLISVSNLAALLQARKELVKAEQLYREACVGLTEKLGPDHATTRRSVQALAAMLRDEKRFADAEKLLREAHQAMQARADVQPEALRQSAESLAALHEAWHQEDPAAGHDATAAEWRRAASAGGNGDK